MHLSTYTWHLRIDFQLLRSLYSLCQPHHVTPSHPSLGDDHQSMRGRSERTQGQAKIVAWNSFSYICTRALHSFRSFGIWCAACTVIPRLPKATITLYPSSLTWVYLVPALNLLPPSTQFFRYGNHPFLPHAQTISILSDLLYSLTPFLFQLSYASLHS